MPGTSGVKFGTKVGASLKNGQLRNADLVGFALGEEFDVDGELKARIQVGTEVHVLGYREPKDRTDDDAGRTFWLV